jgi:hypothetical protein
VISELIVISLIFISFRLFLVRGVKSEENYHINTAKFLKDKRLRINGENSIFVPRGRYSNPILYHYIVSFLPERYISSRTLRMINCVYDFGTIMIFYGYIHTMFGQFFIKLFGNNFSLAFVVGGILCFLPALIPLNSRTRGGGARTMGLFLCVIYFLGLHEFYHGNFIFYGITCVILLFLLLYSGQFGHQVATFGTVTLSFISLEFVYLIPIIVYTLVCTFLSRNLRSYFWCKFLAHYRYYTSVMKGTIVEDRKKNLLNLPLRDNSFAIDKTKIRTFIYLSPLYFLPCMYFSTIYACYSLFSLPEGPIFIVFCQYLSMSLLIVAFITFWYPFSVFGQSERYLEFATPYSLVTLLYFTSQSSALVVFIAFSLVVSIFHLFLINRKGKINTSDELTADEKEFVKNIKNAAILVSPYKRTFDCFDGASKNTNYFMPLINTKKSANWNENYDLFEYYSHYKSDWIKWNERYGITHLLVHAKKNESSPKDYNSITLLRKFKNYYLYTIK